VRADGRDRLSAVGDALNDLKGKAGDMMEDAKQRISETVSSASEAGRGVAEDLRAMGGQVAGSASSYADQASRYTETARRRVGDVFQREPLLLGALGFLVGVAVATALPSSQAEDQLVGRARDRTLDRGKALAQDGIETATEAVHAAYGAVKSELDRPTEGDVAQRARDAVRAGVEAVKTTISDDSRQV
jgi:hypothetical protein